MRKEKLSSAEEAQIDLTPMLDITFIMLIFFIVTAVFVKEAGIDVTRVVALSASPQPRASVMVAINANGDVWINKGEVKADSVRAVVEKLLQENPQGTVVIQADKETPARVTEQVIKQINEAGAPGVALSTERQD
jgi:biopolymer transport protein ExbD